MAEVVVTEYLNDSALEALRSDFAVHYDPELASDPAATAALLPGARALVVRNRTRVTAALLDAGPALRVVGRLGVGLDNIDQDACRARDVEVVAATGANTQSVVEYTLAAVLILLRGAYQCTAEVVAGRWPRTESIGLEASGRTLGLIGFGGIGRAVATRASALGLGVVAVDPAFMASDDPSWRALGVRRVTLDELLTVSDAISVHVPLTPTTHHLLAAREFARMRPGAVIVNTARGGVLDESALAAALRSGHLRGAMLDVFEDEPLPAGSVLDGVPGLVLTPHIAGLTEESNERVGALIATRVREILRGGNK